MIVYYHAVPTGRTEMFRSAQLCLRPAVRRADGRWKFSSMSIHQPVIGSHCQSAGLLLLLHGDEDDVGTPQAMDAPWSWSAVARSRVHTRLILLYYPCLCTKVCVHLLLCKLLNESSVFIEIYTPDRFNRAPGITSHLQVAISCWLWSSVSFNSELLLLLVKAHPSTPPL